MAAFTRDNTEGYDALDLTRLNQAYINYIVDALSAGDFEGLDDIEKMSLCDHICETLLSRYDHGLRGHQLEARNLNDVL